MNIDQRLKRLEGCDEGAYWEGGETAADPAVIVAPKEIDVTPLGHRLLEQKKRRNPGDLG